MNHDKGQSNLSLRPNITEHENAWNLVPGDIVERWKPNYLLADTNEATALQREEKMYYVACCFCGRHEGQIKADGPVDACERNRCPEVRRHRR